MAAGLYLGVFAVVVIVDQLSKQWAMRALPAVDGPGATARGALTRSTSPSLERLGAHGAIFLWLLSGAAGAALCLGARGSAVAALGGVAAWAAAASNLGEWRQRGAVVDWLRLWPRSSTNVADAVLILGSAQFAAGIAAS